MRRLASLAIAGTTLLAATSARADGTAQSLPFSQNWSDGTLIATNDVWSGVPGIIGYRGDDITSATGVDPQTLTVEGTITIDVNADQTNPNTFTTGGVAEFAVTNPTVALQGSGTADAPNLVIALSTAGNTSIVVVYNLRDLDGSADNAVQPVALQYRVGSSGDFINVPSGFVADATTGPNEAAFVAAVSATLPAAANNQTRVEIRIITTNALGNDEWVGIDDISVTGTPIGGKPECGDGIVQPFLEEACDDGNNVDGDCCSSFCEIEESGTLCRGSVSECDAAEVCDGSTPSCPADAAEPEGTFCGGVGGGGPITCDAADTCSGRVGATAVCRDNFEPASTVCRPAVGLCDAAELCTGTSPLCPADAVQPNTAICRAAAGSCDAAERCNGVSIGCPRDALLPASTICRPSAGICDSFELCSGTGPLCPSDSVLPIGTPCRASTGICDPAEACNGFAVCPPDRAAADGASCADGVTCNGAETCRAGTCASGTAQSCDDANLCTADMCAEPGGCASSPIAGCCNINGDCGDDGNVCTTERCTGSGGRCESLPIADCCTRDADCSGASTCVAVSCNLATNRCESAPVPGCCARDSDCGDANACTSDTCNVATGVCSNSAIPSCCEGAGDCDDGDECTADTCDRSGGGAAGTCAAMPIASCCLGDPDCSDADMDACTTPSCNTTTQRCMETAIDCDDMDGCTVDACEADGSCSHTPRTCDDGDDCTADACTAGACENTPILGCGEVPDGGMMGEDAGMMVGMDAALPDAGFTNDAASLRTDVPVDAGNLAVVDAGLGMNDAGDLVLEDTGGCDRCAASPGHDSRGLAIALGVLALVAARRRRR